MGKTKVVFLNCFAADNALLIRDPVSCEPSLVCLVYQRLFDKSQYFALPRPKTVYYTYFRCNLSERDAVAIL